MRVTGHDHAIGRNNERMLHGGRQMGMRHVNAGKPQLVAPAEAGQTMNSSGSHREQTDENCCAVQHLQ